MSNTLKPYLNCVRTTLDAALCLRNFPSQTVERHNKVFFHCLPWNSFPTHPGPVYDRQPEVEVGGSKELILNPVTICRNEREKCRIEPSVNSVRVSIMIKQSDEIEEVSRSSELFFPFSFFTFLISPGDFTGSLPQIHPVSHATCRPIHYYASKGH